MRHDFKAVPEELKGLRQWVNWKYAPNPKNPNKMKKTPINPRTGKLASVTDPETWSGFKTALKRLEEGSVDGIGFVFTDSDPYVGIDLDGCRNEKSGKIQKWALDIISTFSSYTEISPSSSGVHIIVRGDIPGNGKNVDNIEVYSRGRYFTMTGDEI